MQPCTPFHFFSFSGAAESFVYGGCRGSTATAAASTASGAIFAVRSLSNRNGVRSSVLGQAPTSAGRHRLSVFSIAHSVFYRGGSPRSPTWRCALGVHLSHVAGGERGKGKKGVVCRSNRVDPWPRRHLLIFCSSGGARSFRSCITRAQYFRGMGFNPRISGSKPALPS